jgi:hypothetical protein
MQMESNVRSIAFVTCLTAMCITQSAVGQTTQGLAEMATAERFARAAASAGKLQDIRVNLQRSLNCLVGRDAIGYHPSAGDPCQGQGALKTLPAGSVNQIRVRKAIQLASVGVTFQDFKPAHYTALAVQAVLDEGIAPQR